MNNVVKLIVFGLSAAATAALPSRPAAADTVADFYTGKTIQVVIPAGMGGSVGVYGRLVSDHLGRHVPGHPKAILVPKPGGGGVTGINYVYSIAPKDGTVVGHPLGPSLLLPLVRQVPYNAEKFQWLGSLTARPGVLAVWHTAPATTLDGARKVQLNMGSTGIGAGNYQVPTLANAVLGTKFKVISGYGSGGDINLAIESGEVNGRFNYWSGFTSLHADWIRDSKLSFLFRTGPAIKELPGVPALVDLVSGAERQMVRFIEAPDDIGMGFWVSDGVPEDRRVALRKAFWAMTQDKAFLAEAEKRKLPIEPVPAEQLRKITAELYATPEPVLARLKTTLGFDKN